MTAHKATTTFVGKQKKPATGLRVLKAPLLRGLAILLPALITIAVFAWSWGILRDYAVVTIIEGIDSVKVFSPPDALLVPDSISVSATSDRAGSPYKNDGTVTWKTPDGLIYTTSTSGKKRVYLLPEKSYSAMAIGSAYYNLQRDHDYGTGAVVSYTFFEYIVAIALAVVLIILLGLFARAYFGRQIMGMGDRLLHRLPVVNHVYPYAKQVVDFFFSDQRQIEFDKVVAVEFPRKHCWQLGFVTGSGLKTLTEGTGAAHTTVFVPMSPLPMTGFTVYLPKDQVLAIDITVEEAFMIILSGGVLAPPHQLDKGESERIRQWDKLMTAAREERTKFMTTDEAAEARESDVTEGNPDRENGDEETEGDKG